MSEKPVHPVDQLEPGALTDSTLVPPMADHKIDDLRVQMSIAISLKRIADVMTGSCNAYGENFAEAIQGAIARGLRGIG